MIEPILVQLKFPLVSKTMYNPFFFFCKTMKLQNQKKKRDSANSKLNYKQNPRGGEGVTSGTRTHDIQNHNLTL